MIQVSTSTRFGRELIGVDPTFPVRFPPLPRRDSEDIFIRNRPEKRFFDGFAPIYVWNDGNNFVIKAEPSRVEEVIPKSGVDCVVTHPVYYNGQVHLRDDEIAVPDGHILYCKVEQDNVGEVKSGAGEQPEILVAAEVPESSHWYPPDPSDAAGSDGTMYFPLYRIDRTDGVAEITFLHWGPIVVRTDLWVGEQVGSLGSEILKEHAEDEGAVYKFRNLEGDYAITDTEGDDILFKFDGDNMGTGEPVYLEPGHADKVDAAVAEFRSIAPGASLRNEIDVSRKDAGTIQVRGNNVFNTKSGFATLVEVGDGLVKEITNLAFGGDLNLHQNEITYDLESGTEHSTGNELLNMMQWANTTSYETYYWRKGLYIGTTDPSDGLGTDLYVSHLVEQA